MAAPVALRSDYDGATLRRLAKVSEDANQTRRLLALAVVCDGGRRSAAASIGGVGLQVVRDWVLRFNAEGPVGKASEQSSDYALALPTGPSVAVLPFNNLSGDPEQEYFVDGITEDITSALVRFDLQVIARNSSFQYNTALH